MKSEQFSLFPSEPQPPRHDYGGIDTDDNGMGHEFPFVRAGKAPEAPQPATSFITLPEATSVSVNLESRYQALAAAAGMYGRYRRSRGLEKAISNQERRDEIQQRYGRSIHEIAERAVENSNYSPRLERHILQPLLKEKELIEAGFDARSVEESSFETIYRVREVLGTKVDSKIRTANLKKISNPQPTDS